MKAELSLQQLWANASLMKFFFRAQAQDTFEELVAHERGNKNEQAFEELADAIEDRYDYLDEFEEACYNLSVDELLAELYS